MRSGLGKKKTSAAGAALPPGTTCAIGVVGYVPPGMQPFPGVPAFPTATVLPGQPVSPAGPTTEVLQAMPPSQTAPSGPEAVTPASPGKDEDEALKTPLWSQDASYAYLAPAGRAFPEDPYAVRPAGQVSAPVATSTWVVLAVATGGLFWLATRGPKPRKARR